MQPIEVILRPTPKGLACEAFVGGRFFKVTDPENATGRLARDLIDAGVNPRTPMIVMSEQSPGCAIYWPTLRAAAQDEFKDGRSVAEFHYAPIP